MNTGGGEGGSSVVQPHNRVPEYHGAPRDPRYPSSREVRAPAAGLLDACLPWPAFLASALSMIFFLEDPKAIVVMPALALPVFVVIMTNSVLLPKWIHASIGDLIFGLVKICPSDGGWPTTYDLARNIWSQEPRRASGLPPVVQVRRRDTLGSRITG